VDVDVQRDLFLADGTRCVRNHHRALVNIRRVMAWARRQRIRQISLMLSRELNHHGHNGDYCMAGTRGAEKVHYTRRSRHADFEDNAGTDLPRQLLQDYDQVILHRHTEDPFDQPRIDRLLSETRATEFIIIGGLAESSVKSLALGLLVRKRMVTLITDTLGVYDKAATDVALRQIHAKGAKLIDCKNLLGISHLHLVHTCGCDCCRGKVKKTCLEESAL
jgi:nicotinamidase-related amidase